MNSIGKMGLMSIKEANNYECPFIIRHEIK